MIYFNSYNEFARYKFTGKTRFCIKHDATICLYYGDDKENILDNINGPARIDLKTGALEYYINYSYVGKNLSNKDFNKIIKKIIFE
jgi:hypothetical protein